MARRLARNQLAAAVAAAITAGSLSVAHAQVDLSQLGNTGTPGFHITGSAEYDRVGVANSGAGDINGDGLADVIVGAPLQNETAGAAFLVFSRGSADHVTSGSLGGDGITVERTPTELGRRVAESVSGIGDINGDGFPDFAVSDTSYDFYYYDLMMTFIYYDAGAVHVVFGGPTPPTNVNTAAVSPGFTITGEKRDSANLGAAVSGAGDVNGDGFDDLIAVAPQGGPFLSGQAYVIFGSNSGTTVSTETLAADGNGFEIGDSSTNGITQQVSGAGDVNGDGLDDVIVLTTSGGAAVVFGKADTTTVPMDSLAGRGFFITGGGVGTSSSVAGAGDVNGDGLSDIIIGSPNAFVPATLSAGSAFVVFGKNDDTAVNLDSLSASEGFAIQGGDYDNAGTAVAGAGDINGDGLADVLVGVANSLFTYNNGAVFVAYGKTDGASVSLSQLAGNTGGFVINGENTGAKIGNSVSAAGDVSGDGRADLLMGASSFDTATTDVGRSYVLFSDETLQTTAPYVNRAIAGDAPKRAVGVIGDGSDASSPASRTWIDFSAGDAVSEQTVTVNRAPATLSPGDFLSANISWQVGSNRTNFGSAELTFRYTDDEIGGLTESDLRLYQASSPAGPWTPLPTDLDPTRNEASVTVTTLGFFGLGLTPEIDVERSAASIGDGGSDDLGDQDVNGIRTASYDVINSGTTDLTVGTVTISAPINLLSANVSMVPTSPVVPGTRTTFEISYEVAENGPFGFTLTIPNGDADESPYSFDVSGNGINGIPEVEFGRMPVGPLADGSTDAIGNQDVTTPVTLTYDIFNFGKGDLTVASPVPANPSNVSNVAISSPPTSPVPPGGATTFDVTFDIDVNGPFGFDLSFVNGDADENPYDLTVSGNGLGGAPEIDLQRAAASIADGATDTVGARSVTGPVTLTYTVQNLGQGDLSVATPVPASFTNVSNVVISSPPTSPVPPGGFTTFDVTFDVDVNGAFGFDLSFANSDGDENPYDVTVSGDGINGEPEVELRRSGVGILADGATDTVGDRDVTGPVTLTYTVRNRGQDDLTVATPVPANPTNASNVAISSPPTSPVPPGGFTTFDVTFDIDVNGPFGFDLSFVNSDGDGDENPYDLTVSGNGINGVAEVELRRPGVGIVADGATDAVGDRDVTGPVTLSYTVRNRGQDDLTVATPVPASFTNVSNLAISSPPTSPVSPGGATTFDVTFDIDVNGPFGFDLSFVNSDGDENPYDLTVSGNGINGQPEIGLSRLVALADNGSDDLGDTLVGPVTITYQVDNVGQDTLNLGGVSFANDANVSGLGFDLAPTTTVPPGGSTSLAVGFNVVDLGPFSFDLALANDDADEDPYDLTVLGTGTDIQEFPADPANGDLLGSAVASSGNLFAVGVPGTGNDPGQVLVYRIEGNVVILEATIDVPDGFTAAQFGASLDLEGDLLAVGAPGTPPPGAKGQSMQAAIFQRVQGTSGASWNLKTPITSPGSGADAFGSSVALSGNMMVVGAPSDDAMGPDAGMAYVFGVDPQGSVFSTDPVPPPSTDAQGGFGAAVAADKGKFGIGAPNSGIGGVLTGSVSLFQMIGQNISPQGTTTGSEAQAGDQFGASLSLGTGQLMIVGAPGADSTMALDSGAAYLFNVGGAGPVVQSGLVKPQNPESNGSFGTAVGVAGNTMAIGSPGINSNVGGVFVFDTSSLLQTQFIEPVFGQTGFGSAISFDVLNLLIGAPTTESLQGSAFLKRNPDILFQGQFEGL